MERVLSAAHVVADSLGPLRVCGSCRHPLRPLFCVSCRRAFCRCHTPAHAACRLVAHEYQVARLVDAVNSICDWASLSRFNLAHQLPSPPCALTLRLRPPPPSVWLTVRVRPPHQPYPPLSASQNRLPSPGPGESAVQPHSRPSVPQTTTPSHHPQPQQCQTQLGRPLEPQKCPPQQHQVTARLRIREQRFPRRTKRHRQPSRRLQRSTQTQTNTPIPSQHQHQTPQNVSTPSSSRTNARIVTEKPISQQTTQPPPELPLHLPSSAANTRLQTSTEPLPHRSRASSQPDNVQQLDAHATPNAREKQPDPPVQSAPQCASENISRGEHDSAETPARNVPETDEQNPKRVTKRLPSTRESFERRGITPPLKKRRHIHHTSPATITKVLKTSTRLKVSHDVPTLAQHKKYSEKVGDVVEQPAPSVTVSLGNVEQPFASSSIDSKENMTLSVNQEEEPGLDDSHSGDLPVGDFENDADKDKSSTSKTDSLSKADVCEQNIGSTLHIHDGPGHERHSSQLASRREEPQHLLANGNAAEDKLSEGITTPCGRDDGYQEDHITPLRDGLDGRFFQNANKLRECDTIADVSLEPPPTRDWPSGSPRPFISPLTAEKPAKCHSLSLDSAPQAEATESNHKIQPHIAPGTFTVCLSDFDNEEQYDLVFEIITQMGGEPLEHMRQTRPNCLITPLDPKTGAIKSRKMAVHLALAFRVPIVGIYWLLQSFKAGRWIPPEDYDASSTYHKGATGIFRGLIATIDALFLDPDVSDAVIQFREDIERMVTGAGGVIVDSEQLVNQVQGNPQFTLHVHIVKDIDEERYYTSPELPPEKLEAVRCMQDKIPMKVVNMNWISECLFSGQFPPPKRPNSET
eukprot:gb/GEZJ01004667.1/.p1 GENE.gb/GEZJ01004667.1/~~gb/GEZJ01004667.1/.p1  ORF type:complete len:862 (+),score=109.38 gb/GEZJ01004667.1/:1875-4460(+)